MQLDSYYFLSIGIASWGGYAKACTLTAAWLQLVVLISTL